MTYRWKILKTLLHKEALRHLANRGGLAFALLLIACALLLSLFGSSGAGALTPGVRLCYVDFAADGPLVEHLRRHVPEALAGRVEFRPLAEVPTNAAGALVYPTGTGAIQLRPTPLDPDGFKAWFWHPGADGAALAPFEAWFWKEALAFFRDAQGRVPTHDPTPDTRQALLLPTIEAERTRLDGGVDPRAGLATALVLFGLFFVGVYLLPSLTCEERERGVLLAQALSPASPGEIFAAKLLFYPAAGLLLGAALAAAARPAALGQGFFWLALAAAAFGTTGVGLTVAGLARTQRAAGTGAMGYALAVALLLLVCQQCGLTALPCLALEYHAPLPPPGLALASRAGPGTGLGPVIPARATPGPPPGRRNRVDGPSSPIYHPSQIRHLHGEPVPFSCLRVR
jgi:hypothetical protein